MVEKEREGQGGDTAREDSKGTRAVVTQLEEAETGRKGQKAEEVG